MGSKRGKKQEETYRKAADAEREKIVESPLEAKLRIRAENFLTQSEGSGGIEGIDALKPNLDLYNSAVSDQQNDRQSTGILQLARGGNPNQAAALNQYMKFRRQQDAAGQLENAYNQTNAAMTGQGFNLANMANQRMSDRAGLAGQAYSTYLNRPKEPSWLDRVMQFGQLAVGGAQAYFSGGASTAGRGCWIAEAIYGVDDPRTHLVRFWLNFEFRKTFIGHYVMAFYIAFGEPIAEQVKKHGFLRRAFKPLFDKALRRAEGRS